MYYVEFLVYKSKSPYPIERNFNIFFGFKILGRILNFE